MSVHHCSKHGVMWHISSGGCGWCAVEAEVAELKKEVERLNKLCRDFDATNRMQEARHTSVVDAEIERLSRELEASRAAIRNGTITFDAGKSYVWASNNPDGSSYVSDEDYPSVAAAYAAEGK